MSLSPISLEMFRGDDRTLTITASESLTGSDIRFTAKRVPGDGTAVIEKSTDDGSITIGVDPDDTEAEVDAADTEGAGTGVLRWDVEITDAEGKVRTVAIGTLRLRADITTPEAS